MCLSNILYTCMAYFSLMFCSYRLYLQFRYQGNRKVMDNSLVHEVFFYEKIECEWRLVHKHIYSRHIKQEFRKSILKITVWGDRKTFERQTAKTFSLPLSLSLAESRLVYLGLTTTMEFTCQSKRHVGTSPFNRGIPY